MTKSTNTIYKWRVYIVIVVVAVLTMLFSGDFLFTFSLKANALQFDTVIQIIGPALVASLFIERAVEVVVQTWRKFGREKIENMLAKLNLDLEHVTNLEEKTSIATAIEETNTELTNYRSDTMQMAAGFSVFFGFLIALIGVRLLTPFFDIDTDLLNCITGLEIEPEECASGIATMRDHYKWLVRYDVFITTFVIAGGSTGLHSIVSAITSFADKTKNQYPNANGK